jgi:hypothetical protein
VPLSALEKRIGGRTSLKREGGTMKRIALVVMTATLWASGISGSEEPSPQATPQVTPQATPEAAPQATPEATPQATPKANAKAVPQTTPTGSHFKIAMISNDKSSLDEKGVFTPDAPKVFAVYRVVVAGSGSKVRAVWFAEKVEGLEAKTKLAENESAFPSQGEYIGSLSCTKPPPGWPIGSYTVQLYLDGSLRKTLAFRVEKPKHEPFP